MEELITWVNKEDLEMHPVIKAAVFQNRFVWTPPFFDANGCTARLVFNLLFLKEGFPTAIILKVDRKKYYKHLIMPLTGIKKTIHSGRNSLNAISRYLTERFGRYRR